MLKGLWFVVITWLIISVGIAIMYPIKKAFPAEVAGRPYATHFFCFREEAANTIAKAISEDEEMGVAEGKKMVDLGECVFTPRDIHVTATKSGQHFKGAHQDLEVVGFAVQAEGHEDQTFYGIAKYGWEREGSI